MKKQYVLEVIF